MWRICGHTAVSPRRRKTDRTKSSDSGSEGLLHDNGYAEFARGGSGQGNRTPIPHLRRSTSRNRPKPGCHFCDQSISGGGCAWELTWCSKSARAASTNSGEQIVSEANRTNMRHCARSRLDRQNEQKRRVYFGTVRSAQFRSVCCGVCLNRFPCEFSSSVCATEEAVPATHSVDFFTAY